MEFEAVDEGTIGKILIAEGTEGVKVNSPIAILLEDGESADDIGSAPAAVQPRSQRPLPLLLQPLLRPLPGTRSTCKRRHAHLCVTVGPPYCGAKGFGSDTDFRLWTTWSDRQGRCRRGNSTARSACGACSCTRRRSGSRCDADRSGHRTGPQDVRWSVV